jgi:hypothetical protein
MNLERRLQRLEEHTDLRHEWVLQVVWVEDTPPESPPGSIIIVLHWERPTR